MAETETRGAGWADAALALALPGLSPEEAFALREGRDWLHLRAADPRRFAGLLSLADLDAHLRTEAARAPRLSLADESREGSAAVPEAEWALADGRADLPRLLARFDAGATLVLSQFHESHAGLARLCRGLERAFLHPVQANLYLTPPAAQGFRPHYDTHDVLVLQVEGRKRWRIWPGEPVVERPTRRTRWAGGPAPDGDPAEVLLAPGDSLYVPRGAVHEAAALPGERSLHVTLGLLEPSWAQAMRALLAALELEDPRLRDGVPTWRIGEAGFPALLAQRLARLAGAGERVAPLLLGELARDRPPLPARGLFAPFPEGARLRLHEGMHAHLLRGPDGAALHWAGGAERLGEAEAAWVEALAEGAAVPAGCEALARRLWAWGVVERA
jgi:hypothetical protein